MDRRRRQPRSPARRREGVEGDAPIAREVETERDRQQRARALGSAANRPPQELRWDTARVPGVQVSPPSRLRISMPVKGVREGGQAQVVAGVDRQRSPVEEPMAETGRPAARSGLSRWFCRCRWLPLAKRVWGATGRGRRPRRHRAGCPRGVQVVPRSLVRRMRASAKVRLGGVFDRQVGRGGGAGDPDVPVWVRGDGLDGVLPGAGEGSDAETAQDAAGIGGRKTGGRRVEHAGHDHACEPEIASHYIQRLGGGRFQLQLLWS